LAACSVSCCKTISTSSSLAGFWPKSESLHSSGRQMEIQALEAVGIIDFSMWSLFAQAGIVVKSVMVLLLLMSVWSWTIIVHKYFMYGRAKRHARSFKELFWAGQQVNDVYAQVKQQQTGALHRIFCQAMEEWIRSHGSDGELIAGVRVRIDRAMDNTMTKEVERLTRGLTFLATVGSTAPFLGLFGTVWGIITVFRDIGLQENTNLAVVAPGIGEALAATALGLLAAIPAVVFHNSLSDKSDGLVSEFGYFVHEFSAIISREVEQRIVPEPESWQ